MYMSHYIPHIYSISYVYIYTHSVLLAQSCPTLCEPTDCSPPCLLSPWSSPGKNTGVGYHLLLQGIYPTQGLNPALLHCRHIYTHIYIIVKYFICICIMEYYSAFKKKKKETLSFATRWMSLEGIMLSEMKQTKKDKYCMIQYH